MVLRGAQYSSAVRRVAGVVGLRGCFCKQKTAYEMRISDWSSDVCSSDLSQDIAPFGFGAAAPSLMCAYCLVGWYITSSERYAATWPTTGLLAQRLGPQLSRVVGESGGSCYGNGVFRRSVFAGAFLAVRFTGGFCARNAGTRSCCGLLKAGCPTTRESTSAPIRTLR